MIDLISRLLTEGITEGLTEADKKALAVVFWRTLLVVHILWACGWLAFLNLPGFVSASEVAKVQKQVEEVAASMSSVETALVEYKKEQRRLALEAEVRRLDQEIFNIEAKIAELQRSGVNADRIYSERLAQLNTERRAVDRALASFMRINPDIEGGLR